MAGQGTMLGRANLEAAFIAFSTVFDMKLKNAPVIYPKLALVIPGVSERLEFKWLGSIPTMKRWIGDRTIQKLRGETQALQTDWWANGIEIDVDDFKVEARLGMLAARVRSLAEAAARRIDDQVAQFYLTGTTGITNGTTYDGVQLYSNSHTAGTGAGVQPGEAQSNLVAGGLATATFNSALQKSMQFLDDEAEPVTTEMRTILAGPANQLTIRQLFKLEYNAAGASNPDYGMADAVIAPRFGASTAWMLLTQAEIKSVVVGIEFEPQFAASDDPSSPEMFKRRTALYGAHVKFGTCYGPWQASVGSAG
jgi:phage major head subunit gpT-like protein